jgi:hypothetical protein
MSRRLTGASTTAAYRCPLSFCQKVFDVAQTQGEAKVEPDRLLYDL